MDCSEKIPGAGAGRGAPAAVGTDPPAGMLRRASPRASPLAAAAFSAMMAPSSRARPLLTPLQSLNSNNRISLNHIIFNFPF